MHQVFFDIDATMKRIVLNNSFSAMGETTMGTWYKTITLIGVWLKVAYDGPQHLDYNHVKQHVLLLQQKESSNYISSVKRYLVPLIGLQCR
jgi:hypothetical protein